MKPAESNRSTDRSAVGHRNLPLLLLHAREAVLSRFRPILNANDVTEQQWRIIRALLETGPQEPREIVTLCGISSPSLAGILARMDDLGFVRRGRIDGDQRRVRVSLTAKSRTLARRIAPQIEVTYTVIEAALGRAFTDETYRALDAMIARLGGADAGGDES